MKNNDEEKTEGEELLTTAEAARLLNVHPNTIRSWSNSGILRVFRLGRRRDRRFRLGDVMELLKKEKKKKKGEMK